MSGWSRRVREALGRPAVQQGIAQLFEYYMKDHIDRSEGRGRGGNAVSHKPLSSVSGRRWVDSVGPNEVVVSTREVTTKVKMRGRNGDETRLSRRKQYLVKTQSYRAGGHPLRDTSEMYGALNAVGMRVGRNKLRVTLRGPMYALYQDRGFSTSGPNYIPLSFKGKRKHGTGNNPNNEGLIRGKDYMMAWNGVTVPARPFLLPTRTEMRAVGKSIYMSLKSILKGR